MTSKTALVASAAPRAMFHAPTTGPMMLRGPMVAYAPDDGASPLSVADAVAALRDPAAEEQPAAEDALEGEPAAEPEAEELPPESEPEPTGEEDPDPETVIEGDEDAEPESDPETPVIAAPQSWDAAERAEFAKLSPVAQEIILKRETERDRAVSKAQQEAGTVRKQAEADLVALAQIKTTFDEIATRANQVFADKWTGVDWVELAKNADPATYNSLKAQFDAEATELQKVQQGQADAEKVRLQAEQTKFQSYVREEYAELSHVAPELADPKKGPVLRSEVTQFLQGLHRSDGRRAIPDENIERISAVEMAVARDAMEFRKLKASGQAAAARPKPVATRPAPTPARAAAPSAAAPVRPTAQRNVESAMSRLAQTGKVDDAMAVMRARRGAN